MNLPYWTDALGWTLLHSLWQGGLLALLYFVGRYALRQHCPPYRYLLALGTLVALLGWSGYTLVDLWPEAPVEVAASSLVWDTPSAAPVAAAAFSWKTWLRPALPWLSLAWLIGAALLALRWLGGMGYTQSLRYRGTRPAPPTWQAELATWQQRLGLRRPVKLLLSHRISSPLTLGFFKPVILIPVSLLSGLTPAQWEAILLHELAHIRRADYLINVIQSLVEILFFYHPLVWGLSRDLSREREACCDDLAVSACGDASRYAEALTRLQRIRFTAKTPFAMQFSSSKKEGFTARIQRLFAPATQPQRPRLAGLLALALIAFLAIVPQFATNAAVPNHTELQAAPAAAEPVVIEIDRSWTRAQLEELQASLAAEGVKLHFSQIETDDEGHLQTLAGSIELPNGKTGSFTATGLGTLRLVYDESGLLQVDVRGEEEEERKLPEEEAEPKEKVEHEPFVFPGANIVLHLKEGQLGKSPLIILDGKAVPLEEVAGLKSQGLQSVRIAPIGDEEARQYGLAGKEGVIILERKAEASQDSTASPAKPEGAIAEKKAFDKGLHRQPEQVEGQPDIFEMFKEKDSGHFFWEEEDSLENPVEPIFFLNHKRVDRETLKALSPSDISFVQVLKGKAAIKAYGEEAAGGAVLLTSKEQAPTILEDSQGGGLVIEQPNPARQRVREVGLQGNLDKVRYFIDGLERDQEALKEIEPGQIDRFEVLEPKGEEGSAQIQIFTKKGKQAQSQVTSALQVKAFPNPATDQVQVEVQLEKALPLRVEVHDLQGRLIETLTDNKEASAGPHLYPWKVKNVPAGTYLIRTFAGELSRTDKVVIE